MQSYASTREPGVKVHKYTDNARVTRPGEPERNESKEKKFPFLLRPAKTSVEGRWPPNRWPQQGVSP